jgi:hypothetical protein
MRESVKYANWTKEREEWYFKECDEILYRTGFKLDIVELKVYLESDKKKIVLVLDNPKSKWFQIWLKLRNLK